VSFTTNELLCRRFVPVSCPENLENLEIFGRGLVFAKGVNMTLRKFQDCIRESGELRHLLLGNGFSRACRDKIFSYDSLFDAADWEGILLEHREVPAEVSPSQMPIRFMI
jgi:hypothetical protein